MSSHSFLTPLRWLLVLTALVAALALWRSRRVAAPLPAAKAACLHWVGIRGDLRRPTVRCLRREGGERMSERQWRAAVQNSAPRCQLPSALPFPAHGEALHLRGSERCQLTVKPLAARTRVLLGVRLEINRASAVELRAIPRLSRKVAERIVQHRNARGPFRSWEELLEIRGVGENSLRRFRRFLRLRASGPRRAVSPRRSFPPTRRGSGPAKGGVPSARSTP